MALIGRLISLLDNSHEQNRPQQPYQQDPYHQDPYHQNPHNGPYQYNQPPMNAGYHHTPSPLPAMHCLGGQGRKAERHYRRAERTMQRAEHRAGRDIRRAERDMRKAERRGEILPSAPVMHQHQPVYGMQGYARQGNGYETRDMGYQQQQQYQPQPQGSYTPELHSREMDRAGPSTRQFEDDVPPPAYELDDRKN